MRKIHISDEHLIEAYLNALRLNLSPDFISLLESEINTRGLVFLESPSHHKKMLETSI